MGELVRTAAFWFSAPQLLWASVFVLGTGFLLLAPLFVGPARTPTALTEALRSLHTASSIVLIFGTLGHGVSRALRTTMSARALGSGVLATTVLGFGAVSGVMASAPTWWAATLRTDAERLENWSSVFHFGYSAAIFVALVFWHVRIRTTSILSPPNRATYALAALILAAGLLTMSDEVPATLTRLIVPALTVWAWWTIVAPQLFWLVLLRGRGRPRARVV